MATVDGPITEKCCHHVAFELRWADSHLTLSALADIAGFDHHKFREQESFAKNWALLYPLSVASVAKLATRSVIIASPEE